MTSLHQQHLTEKALKNEEYEEHFLTMLPVFKLQL